MVALVLAVNGSVEAWIIYGSTMRRVADTQRVAADDLAVRTRAFVMDLQRKANWVTRASALTLQDREADYRTLLDLEPTVASVTFVDGAGHKQVEATRENVLVGSNADVASDPLVQSVQARPLWVGASRFGGNGVAMDLAFAHTGSRSGLTVVRVDRSSLDGIIRGLPAGDGSYAYLVGQDGEVVASSPHAPVRADTAIGASGVATILKHLNEMAHVSSGVDGSVVRTAVPIAGTDLIAVLEKPASLVFQALHDFVIRLAWLLALGLVLATLAGLFLARRMLVPIRALHVGAASLAAGQFDTRIAVQTQDELQDLATQFNSMAEQLSESYGRLEAKVEERTHELANSLEELIVKSRQLEVANAHKTQFFANMSHELRTPLNAVLGYSELLHDGLYGELSQRATSILERIQVNGKQLLGLINDVLDITKMDASALTLSLNNYSMQSLIESVVSSTESLAKTKGLEFGSRVQGDLPLGHGDDRRLTQVFVNLVGNAIKFTDAGAVRIEASLAGDDFQVAVSDTGPGISVEQQAQIFDEFHQVDDASTRKKGGSGLGLAIARRLVTMHGGSLKVESAPGAGATFIVRIPVRVQDQRQAA